MSDTHDDMISNKNMIKWSLFYLFQYVVAMSNHLQLNFSRIFCFEKKLSRKPCDEFFFSIPVCQGLVPRCPEITHGKAPAKRSPHPPGSPERQDTSSDQRTGH